VTQLAATHACEILEDLNGTDDKTYLPATLTSIGKPVFKAGVADSPDIFQVDEKRGPGAVLILSNDQQPAFARIGADAAQDAANCMADRLAQHVLVARQIGRWNTKSFAIYKRSQPLSPQKGMRALQLKFIKTDVLGWLAAVAKDTKTQIDQFDVQQTCFQDPCRYLIDDAAMPPAIKMQAQRTLSGIEDQTFKPVTILQHGDFWSGNLLLARGWPLTRSGLRHFEVIDWGSSTTAGYPFIDLLRFTRSLALSEPKISKHVREYCRVADLQPSDLLHYVTVASGHLGLNRGHFPHERYIAATKRLFERALRLCEMHQ
jgi:hypothetical protein